MEDVGLKSLERIHRVQQIDEPWTIRGERLFAWIGHRLQQTISASKLFDDDGTTLSRLTAACVVVNDVSADDDEVFELLNRLNRHAIGSAYTYAPSARQITATTSAHVHKDTVEWRTDQFGAFSVSQICLAESEADYLAEKLGGRVASREHPTSGIRSRPDFMLTMADQFFAKEGQSPSRFANKFEMQTIAELSSRSGACASLGGSADGVALEMSYGERTSLGCLAPDEPHRRIGNGLSYRLHLPDDFAPGDAARVADALNRDEAIGTGLPTHYGAWCWDEWPNVGHKLAYRGFIPNATYRPGIAQDTAASLIHRAKRVDSFMHAKPTKSNVWETLAKRFGTRRKDADVG